MEKQYSVQFFTAFVEAMQKLCREYLEFDQGVELSGYLAVEIDNFKKERYVLSELIQNTGHVISESYCTKAFKTHRKEVSSYGSENQAPQPNRFGTRTTSQGPDSSHGSSSNQDRFSSRMFSSIRPRSRQYFSHHRKPVRTTLASSAASGSRTSETITLIDDSNSGNQYDESAGSQDQDFGQNRLSHDSSFPSQQTSMGDLPQTSHALVSSPISSTPIKRNSSALEEDTPANKKDKLDSSIDALYDAAKDIATSAQSDIDSMNSSYPMSKFTRTSVSSSETMSTAVSSGQTAASHSDDVRMPLTVKEEKPDDVPYMVLDDPNMLDPEVHVKTLEHENSQSFGLDGSTSYSSDMPSASTSFTGLQDSMHSGNAADGSASWDNQATPKGDSYNDMTEDLRYSVKSRKDHVCETCNKTFTYNWTLVRHQQSVHQRLFIHTCPICSKTFNRKDVLAHHVNSHLKMSNHMSYLRGCQPNMARPDVEMELSSTQKDESDLSILNDLPPKEDPSD